MAALVSAMDGKPGDLLLFAADKNKVVYDVLGNLRLELARQLDLLKKDDFKFLWVTEFPLLNTPRRRAALWPCTIPSPCPWRRICRYIDSDPGRVRAKAYDIVLNGVEMGGGSVRIHQADIQSKMFEVLGFTQERANDQFGFLLEAFNTAFRPTQAWPTAWTAWLCSWWGQTASRCDCLPKVKDASCLMTEAPSAVDEKQLRSWGLKLHPRRTRADGNYLECDNSGAHRGGGRKAYLYLPESYDREPDKRYPALYMFDGHNVFFDSDATYGKSWGMKEYMDFTGTQLLIAAVECNHSPDNGRLREYSPFPFDDPKLGHFPGLGRKTMEWMIGSFKKDIDSRFRTLADRENTFIAGSSMGGSYESVRGAGVQPGIFPGGGALPLYLGGPGEAGAAGAQGGPGTGHRGLYGLWLPGDKRQGRNASELCRMASLLMERRVLVSSRIVPAASDCEASWERQIPFFMNTLLYRQ